MTRVKVREKIIDEGTSLYDKYEVPSGRETRR